MNKQEFINQFTDFMNRIAEDVFPSAETLSLFDAEKRMPVKAYSPRGKFQRVSEIAAHYEQPIELFHQIIEDLGIKEIKSRGGNIIAKDDTLFLIKHLGMKYDNFNI